MKQTDNDRQDNILLLCADMTDSTNRIVALAKEKRTNVRIFSYVDSTGNDQKAYAYGEKTIRWKSTDTFDALAYLYYGDASKGSMIAYYNGIQNEHDIEVGTKIYIPELNESSTNKANRIYAVPEEQDLYGIDIKLDEKGDFAYLNGDFAFVGGQENLSQSMLNRLTTSAKKRIRLTSYGIRSAIGDNVALGSYLKASIMQTVLADPRISEIKEIKFTGKGDALTVRVTYTDLNGEDGETKGSI